MSTTSATQKLDIRPTNLYSNGYIVDFPEDGESVLLRDPIIFISDDTDEYYTVVANERLDLIAYEKYKAFTTRAAELWWAIADANGIMNPLDLRGYVGRELLIPNYSKIKAQQ